MTLRYYQRNALDDLDRGWTRGLRAQLLRMPTGSGKSLTTANALKDHAGGGLMMAHRREIVAQLALALAREGVRHRVIGPPDLARLCMQVQIDDVGTHFVAPGARIAVASTDSLSVVKGEEDFLRQVTLAVPDECFPAGTPIDGTPIENIRVGDTVTAYDDRKDVFVKRKVVRLFKNPTPGYMVRVACGGHHYLTCTAGHPFFTKRGWVPAAELKESDELRIYEMPHVWPALGLEQQGPHAVLREVGPGVLQPQVLAGVPIFENLGGGHTDQSEVRQRAHEEKEPHARQGDSGEIVENAPGDEAQTAGTGRERQALAGSGSAASEDVRGSRICGSVRRANDAAVGERERRELQDRRGEPAPENSDRSGRPLARVAFSSGPGCQEGQGIGWARVDSVTFQKQDDPDRARKGGGDGYVYNLEVEDLHTYVANGVVVHNCHHYLRENAYGKAINRLRPECRLLMPTATPARTDGKGLGEWADGFAQEIVEGPTEAQLMQEGFLCKYLIYVPPTDFNREALGIGSGHEFKKEDVKRESKRSHIFGDAVKHYCRHTPGKTALAFVDSIESAVDLCADFRAESVKAEVLTGKTESGLRTRTLKAFAKGQVDVIISVQLIDEGFDCPSVQVVLDLAATTSLIRYRQRFGRGWRPDASKDYFRYFDFVGNVKQHGLPEAYRKWSLDRRQARGKNEPNDHIPTRTCENPECGLTYERVLPQCPYCLREPTAVVRNSPEVVDGDLIMLDEATRARMLGEIARIDQAPALPYGATHAVVGHLRNIHHAKQQAQAGLRDATALWGGWQAAQGRTEREGYRRFYHRYGLDLYSAWALGTTEAANLEEKIRRDMREAGIIDGTVN